MKFCTQTEIHALTGRKKIAQQRRWLDQNSFTYCINASGRVVMICSHVEARLNPQQIPNQKIEFVPDWSSLDGK